MWDPGHFLLSSDFYYLFLNLCVCGYVMHTFHGVTPRSEDHSGNQSSPSIAFLFLPWCVFLASSPVFTSVLPVRVLELECTPHLAFCVKFPRNDRVLVVRLIKQQNFPSPAGCLTYLSCGKIAYKSMLRKEAHSVSVAYQKEGHGNGGDGVSESFGLLPPFNSVWAPSSWDGIPNVHIGLSCFLSGNALARRPTCESLRS